ncbi:aminopeptidase N [Methylocella silvestris BL2]|uniref:Aminopeptidase N n=1 Tax=Methylocella silvestris (strain DSM 15510 / CIP 108128 / LMG 27833 / NCIMB 13906 / BL2) TaxID=395965 RepID=B8EN40_METSB|nr:aminopeptidase N [Methylocella silvestris]ACK49175.1 aminopeptidase N [Methylocella silvestris BL2]
MRTDSAEPVRLKDYKAPDYLIDSVDLNVKLHPTAARVVSRLSIRPNPNGRPDAALILDGDGLIVKSIAIDRAAPADGVVVVSPQQLALANPPQRPFTLDVETEVNPTANSRLMGLFRSGSAYCTQCEPEGFRRITFFLDRPDVLSVYTVRLEASRAEAPLLLANGNLVEAGELATGEDGVARHYAVWHDPFPKPSYLFALVGGDLGSIHDAFLTRSGRRVALGIYVEHGKEPLAAYAMDSLKRAMAWDETAFGREYDLDVFNIVAVSDFNMGAMENKGLNIFNDKYVLASPATATDADYAHIEAVIAHEYFHNWTGNRITCRDWFQLCLKEGLTVFRDHEFSSDMRSRAVHRIADVRALRAAQFPEDAGPLAHNVRPETYYEINNFYTATIYEKGAEVIRMLKVLIGAESFSRGMDLYFERYDGTAATVEDFISCFAEASGRDLSDFFRWYRQSGTPLLEAASSYDASAGTFTLHLEQSSKPTPGQDHKEPFVIPVALGLVGPDGDLPLKTETDNAASAREIESGVFVLSTPQRTIIFRDVESRPALSILRGFSAPVRLDYAASEADLIRLIARDSDSFTRWQAAQTYASRLLTRAVADIGAGKSPAEDYDFVDALASVLTESADPAYAAQMITLPSEADIARDIGENIDPDAIHAARFGLRRAIGKGLSSHLHTVYARLAPDGPYSPDAAAAGRRALRNAALDLLCAGEPEEGAALASRQFASADTMTDEIAALGALAQTPGETREAALKTFYRRHAHDALVVDKWFALQAMLPDADTLSRIKDLTGHPAFSFANPNRVRSLVGAFATGNLTRFNAADGSGFDFVVEIVLCLDPKNPQVAARLLSAFKSWRTLEPGRKALAEAALRRIAVRDVLSADVRDIVDRSLG